MPIAVDATGDIAMPHFSRHIVAPADIDAIEAAFLSRHFDCFDIIAAS
jgi:hypothetical protein